MKERFTWIYKVRGLLMLPVSFLIVFSTSYEIENDTFIWPVGGFIFLLGVAVRVWAQMHLHYRLSVRKQLTTTGPYAYVRNPIYIGNTLLMIGLTIMSELLWALPIMLLWCAVLYSFVVRREEQHLLNKYGDAYAQFLRSTPRWIPRFPSRRIRPTQSKQAKLFLFPSIVAELHCFLWLLPLIAKELLSDYPLAGFHL